MPSMKKKHVDKVLINWEKKLDDTLKFGLEIVLARRSRQTHEVNIFVSAEFCLHANI